MQSDKTLIAHRSIVELHEWIEDVFTGNAQQNTSLEKLLNSFTPQFRMVTTSGHCVDFGQVETLFRQNQGKRPQLHIVIDICETLSVTDNRVVCRYRETHHGEGEPGIRWSVAVIDIDNDRPYWQFLQETAFATLP